MQRMDTSKQMVTRRCLLAGCMAYLPLALGACASVTDVIGRKDEPTREPVEVRMALINTPAALGLVPLVHDARADEMTDHYSFAFVRDYNQAQDALAQGMVDIALMRPTSAATVYNSTEGDAVIIDLASYADWTVLSANRVVKGIDDFAGRSLNAVSSGGNEGAVLRHLLSLAGIAEELTPTYRSSDTEVIAALTADPAAIGITAEPITAAGCAKNPRLKVITTLRELWDELADDGSACVGYALVARKSFAAQHPEVIDELLAAHASSAEKVVTDPVSYAEAAQELGLVSDAELFADIVGGAQLACVSGAEMRDMTAAYLQVIASEAPAILGGALPGEDLYYVDGVIGPVQGETTDDEAADEAAPAS